MLRQVTVCLTEKNIRGCRCEIFYRPAVCSVTLNLVNKFSQCTFGVAEHYDLFSDLIIIRQASRRRSYDVIPH